MSNFIFNLKLKTIKYMKKKVESEYSPEFRLNIYEKCLIAYNQEDSLITRNGLCLAIEKIIYREKKLKVYHFYSTVNTNFPELKLKRRLRGKNYLDYMGLTPKRIKVLQEAINIIKTNYPELNI